MRSSPAIGGAGGGINVTLSGAGFGAGATVGFGGVAATGVVVNSASSITVTAPPHQPGPVDVVVATGGQTATKTAAFLYQPVPPVLLPMSATGSTLRLEWMPGSSTPALGYYVIGGARPGGSEYGPFPMGLTTSAAATVAPGTYYARVVADTAWGPLYSNEVSAVVGAAAVPPAPTLAPASVSGSTVTLSWSAPPGGPYTYAAVARASAGGPPIAILPVNGLGFSVSAPPGRYYVTVVALNPYGPSAESNQIVVNVG